mgnify:CR=1 FL=1
MRVEVLIIKAKGMMLSRYTLFSVHHQGEVHFILIYMTSKQIRCSDSACIARNESCYGPPSSTHHLTTCAGRHRELLVIGIHRPSGRKEQPGSGLASVEC